MLTIVIGLCGSAIVSFGQDSTKTNNNRIPFKISGGVNGSAIGYTASGIPARRDPFYWLLSGNFTLSYWKITAPFTFTASQQDQTFRYPQPFNQFGISPNYKSVTLHLGYRSMNFSEFTLAGPIFLGAGVDVAPEKSKIKVSAMYGRLAKAREVGGINDLEFGLPSYERWGYGSKITLGKNGNEVDLITFRGRDDPNSLQDSSATRLGISPAENFVWGLNVRRNISSKVNMNVEYALSAYTKDLRDPEVELNNFRYANYLPGLYSPTISSQFNGAFQGQASFMAAKYQLNLKYRRLGPEYKTMGSPFMNNDFEDITGGIASSFFDNRVSVALNSGVQRNNLSRTQETQVKRFIGSANLAYSVSEKLNINFSYGNFNSSSKQVQFLQQSQIDVIDSLLYLQVTNNLTAGVNYTLQQGAIQKSISSSNSYQVASDNQGNKSIFYNANLGYQMTFTPLDFTFNANFNVNSNKVGMTDNLSAGPTVALMKSFLEKKIRSTFSTSYIQAYQSRDLASGNMTFRMAWTYTTKSKHVFGIDTSFLNRDSRLVNSSSFTEFRGGLTYNYSFSN
ncbi:MAG: hypothetical protein RIF39_15665 [Cyclobacteriaceae bacterium]